MNLADCVLDVDVAVTAPIQRNRAEDDWLKAEESKAIPRSLFNLYVRAKYLSFAAAPSYLQDSENILFSYFGMVLRCIKGSLEDASEHLKTFIEAESQGYDAGKQIRGEKWDKTAGKRSRHHFRYFLISLLASLDATADLAALMLPGAIARLQLGRAQFTSVESWLLQARPTHGTVFSPQEHYLLRLHDTLKPLVHPESNSPERNWLPFMRMLRNKAAHFGDPVFRTIGLHDKTPKFYQFVPRVWPYVWEKYIKPTEQQKLKSSELPNIWLSTLIHQDIVSFTKGLRLKVDELVGVSIVVLGDCFDEFKGFSSNEAALKELEQNSEEFDFEYFKVTD